MTVPFVDLQAQYAPIRRQIADRMQRVLEHGAFILGPEVAEFEEGFATYLGAGHAVGVASGTDALMLALRAVGVRTGDEVITAANTFVATVEAIVHIGATPVLVDVDPRTFCIDVSRIEAHITPRTKAIVPIHLYGRIADMPGILAVARRHSLRVVEDAAQAHGAELLGKRAGTFGDAGCFSFYPAKNLGAYGDAGAVVTNDVAVAVKVRKLRDHGGLVKYQHEDVGYTSRLDTLQAAVLLVKLQFLDEWNARRRGHAVLYGQLLSGVQGVDVPDVPGPEHVCHLYVIRLREGDRDGLKRHLLEAGIHTGIHYPSPVHLTGMRSYLRAVTTYPVAEMCAGTILSLPMYPELSAAQIAYVAGRTHEYIESGHGVRPAEAH